MIDAIDIQSRRLFCASGVGVVESDAFNKSPVWRAPLVGDDHRIKRTLFRAASGESNGNHG
jgi:hypothetical protein